jgi:hypothetical protein
MINKYEAVCEMRISRGNWSASVQLCPPRIPHGLAWDRPWAVAMGSQIMLFKLRRRPYLRLHSVECWMSRQGSGRKFSQHNRRTVLALASRYWRKPQEPSVRTSCVPVDIRTEHLPNTSPEHYHYSNLLGFLYYYYYCCWCYLKTLSMSHTLQQCFPDGVARSEHNRIRCLVFYFVFSCCCFFLSALTH